MRILIRADSSTELGSGHTVRCLGLAEHLKKAGCTITFFSKALPGNLNNWIIQSGYSIVEELKDGMDFEVCIMDHYQTSIIDEVELRKCCKTLVVIDDWGVRKHQADLIIDPSISSQSKQRINVNLNTPFFTGADWLMLRSEFLDFKKKVRPRKYIKNILIFFGSTDPENLTFSFLQSLGETNENLSQYHFNVLITKSNPQYEKILKCSIPENVSIICEPKSVAEVMSRCDFYIGAAGSITWERMCLGLTGIVVTVAGNQEDIAKTVSDMKLHLYVGKSTDFDIRTVFTKIEDFQQSPDLLCRMSSACLALIDGLGLQRITQKILNLDRAGE